MIIKPFPISKRTCESYFASTGSTGVVDLGTSQTVIGSDQVSDLLSKLPKQVRQQVKRTHCNLVFRFGNHQTLPSRHALLLPLQGSRFQIAVVQGNTPFLLSSNFLRKTIQAVMDTEQGTLWSKVLKKELIVDITPKNLFLLDINQLWEDRESTLATSTQSAQSDHVGLKPMDDNHSAQEKQGSDDRPPSFVACCEKDRNKHNNQVHKPDQSCDTSSPKGVPREESLGPKVIPSVIGLRRRASRNMSAIAQRVSAMNQRQKEGDRQDIEKLTIPTQRRESGIRNKDAGEGLHHSIPGPRVGRVVRESLRDFHQRKSPQVCAIRGVDVGPGGEEPIKVGEGGSTISDSRTSQEVRIREVVDQCPSGRGTLRGRDGDGISDGTSGGRSGVHVTGESPIEPMFGQHGVCDGRDHRPPQESSGQDRTMTEARQDKIDAVLFAHNQILHPQSDNAYEFLADHEALNYTKQSVSAHHYQIVERTRSRRPTRTIVSETWKVHRCSRSDVHRRK